MARGGGVCWLGGCKGLGAMPPQRLLLSAFPLGPSPDDSRASVWTWLVALRE